MAGPMPEAEGISRRMAILGGGAALPLLVAAPARATAAGGLEIVVDAAGGADYTKVEAAVAAAPEGAHVIVRPGIYTIKNAPMRPRAGVTLSGAGYGTVLRARDGLDTNVLNLDRDGITVESLRIDGNGLNQTPDSGNGIALHNSRRCVIRNCYVHDAPGYNIVAFSGTTELLVAGNYSYTTVDHTPLPTTEGIELHGASHCAVVGNVVTRIRYHGIFLWNSTGNCGHNVVSGNVAHGNGFAGIRLQDGVHDNVIVGNTCTQNTWGIRLDLLGQSGPAVGNVVRGNTASRNSADGIRVWGANRNDISGNVLRANVHNGIHLLDVATCTVDGNMVDGNGRSGILLEDANDCVCTSNLCVGNGASAKESYRRSGILLLSKAGPCANNIVSSNRCRGRGPLQSYGIYAANHVEDNLVVNNLTSGNAVAGQWREGGDVYRYAEPNRRLSVVVGPQQVAVAHGLPFTPTTVLIGMTSPGSIWRSQLSDATNVYLRADAEGRRADILIG